MNSANKNNVGDVNKSSRTQYGKSAASQNNVANDGRNGSKNKGLCYICQSPNHRQFSCPARNQSSCASHAKAPVARNFACAVDSGDTDFHDRSMRAAICSPDSHTGSDVIAVITATGLAAVVSSKMMHGDGKTW